MDSSCGFFYADRLNWGRFMIREAFRPDFHWIFFVLIMLHKPLELSCYMWLPMATPKNDGLQWTLLQHGMMMDDDWGYIIHIMLQDPSGS